MGASSSVVLAPDEKAYITKALEERYQQMKSAGNLSEADMYNRLSEIYNQETKLLIERRRPSSGNDEDAHHSIDTDFHPEQAIVNNKTSCELIASVNDALAEHNDKITSYISQLKSGDINTKSNSFRARRLSLSTKTSHQPEPPMAQKQLPKKTSVYASTEIGVRQEKKPPFNSDVLGTFSCHGIEPDSDSPDGIHEKTNQDRGCVAYPFNPNNGEMQTLFIVLDGHGEQGDRVSEFVMRQIVVSLEKHADINVNPVKALKETFVKTNMALLTTNINYTFSGCTCVASYLRGNKLFVANVGDSRAVMAVKPRPGSGSTQYVAKDLSRDHKPDDPEETARIKKCGGFVAGPREPGLSARVYLDKECTMIGLAMSRSIGDFAVKDVGVIAEPEVKEFDVTSDDVFMIMASDGVWEFIPSQEAVDIVQKNLENGADFACKELISTAMTRWQIEEGDYRDDITALIVRFPLIPAVTV